MSVSTEERSIRRRLVYNAMPTDLPLDIVQQCIGILENEFGEQPEIKYSQLIKRLNESITACLLYTSPSPRDQRGSRMPSSA